MAASTKSVTSARSVEIGAVAVGERSTTMAISSAGYRGRANGFVGMATRRSLDRWWLARRGTRSSGRCAQAREHCPDGLASLGYACSVMGLTEAERVKRWLRGMRAADELSQRLRAAEGSKPAETVTPTAGRQTAARRKVGARAARRR